MKRVPAAKFRHQIELQKDIGAAQDTLGQHDEMWSAFDSTQFRYASITQLGGKEIEISQQLFAQATVQVLIRHVPGLTAGMRVKYGNRLLFIGWVNNWEEDNQYDQLLCAELASV